MTKFEPISSKIAESPPWRLRAYRTLRPDKPKTLRLFSEISPAVFLKVAEGILVLLFSR
ncbi:hypothetical protein KA093_02025 [Candidatus Saccharibacteria bacterium]|nr:hypothetical protein [Candidatus Saccharibacteria bacterium]